MQFSRKTTRVEKVSNIIKRNYISCVLTCLTVIILCHLKDIVNIFQISRQLRDVDVEFTVLNLEYDLEQKNKNCRNKRLQNNKNQICQLAYSCPEGENFSNIYTNLIGKNK